MKLIVKFSRQGAACYMSHLDLLRCVQRTLRRAGIPMAYSQGFNPHPVLSFAQAMGVGLATRGDYFEVGMAETMAPQAFVDAFNAAATPGVRALEARWAAEKEKTVMSQVEAATYCFSLSQEDGPAFASALAALLAKESVPYEKKSKAGFKQDDMRPRILQAAREGGAVYATLSCGNDNLQPRAFWQTLCQFAGRQATAHITRTELWRREDGMLAPLSSVPGQARTAEGEQQ